MIPPTIGILKDVFEFISLGKAPLQMEVIIDDIAEVLQVADVNKIRTNIIKREKAKTRLFTFMKPSLIFMTLPHAKKGVYIIRPNL